jgi:hypothetical protein
MLGICTEGEGQPSKGINLSEMEGEETHQRNVFGEQGMRNSEARVETEATAWFKSHVPTLDLPCLQ